MSEEELQKLGSYFAELRIKPQLDSAEIFQEWLEKQGQKERTEIKKEPASVKEEQRVTMDRVPRISPFWGTTEQKDATSYDLWHYEVECLLNEGHYCK